MILRELITFADDGADVFFGEARVRRARFLRTAPDGRGVISLLEVPGVADKPAVLDVPHVPLAELYELLPEVGDLDKPKLVFFFDERTCSSRMPRRTSLSITQTVRLIRSKGVGSSS